jgi:hypothetical protein
MCALFVFSLLYVLVVAFYMPVVLFYKTGPAGQPGTAFRTGYTARLGPSSAELVQDLRPTGQ